MAIDALVSNSLFIDDNIHSCFSGHLLPHTKVDKACNLIEDVLSHKASPCFSAELCVHEVTV